MEDRLTTPGTNVKAHTRVSPDTMPILTKFDTMMGRQKLDSSFLKMKQQMYMLQ